MKSPSFILTLLVAAIWVRAEPPTFIEGEFLRLRDKRDKALASAAEPINADYKSSLEGLLRRALAEDNKDDAAKIQFELQSIGAVGSSPGLPPRERAPTPEMIALQKQLVDTKWRINQAKTFILYVDGTSSSNWTPRKGTWKVIDGSTVELDIGNIHRSEKVAITQGATFMTWLGREEDELHSQVAKKIVPVDAIKAP